MLQCSNVLQINISIVLGLLRGSCDRSRHRYCHPGRVVHHGGGAGVFTGQMQAHKSSDSRAGRPVRVAEENVERQNSSHDLSHSFLVIPSRSW